MRNPKMNRRLKEPTKWTFWRWLGIIIIVLCIAIDFYCARGLFRQLKYKKLELIAYAASFVLFMEGLPTFAGKSMTDMFDMTRYKKNDKIIPRIACILSFAAYFAAYGCYIFMRYKLIQDKGGYDGYLEEAIRKGQSNRFYGEVFTTVIPFVTSLLAFVASLFVFKESYYTELCKKVDYLEAKVARAQQKYQLSYMEFKEAGNALWSGLEESRTEHIPEHYDRYKAEVLYRIRQRLNDRVMDAFPAQVERYQSEVESALTECIVKLSTHTTIPYAITQHTVAEIIQKYDSVTSDPVQKWDHNSCGGALRLEMKKALDNAISVAQFRTTFDTDML